MSRDLPGDVSGSPPSLDKGYTKRKEVTGTTGRRTCFGSPWLGVHPRWPVVGLLRTPGRNRRVVGSSTEGRVVETGYCVSSSSDLGVVYRRTFGQGRTLWWVSRRLCGRGYSRLKVGLTPGGGSDKEGIHERESRSPSSTRDTNDQDIRNLRKFSIDRKWSIIKIMTSKG